MTVDNINVEATVKKVKELLAQEQNLSPALRSMLDVLLLVVQLLLALPSRNIQYTITHALLGSATGVNEQFPGRDFNPLD